MWVVPADVDELDRPGEGPAEMAVRLSQLKARVVSFRSPGSLIVSADTLVCLDGAILGKPADDAQAVAMLRSLRGRPHQVYSGVTLIDETGVERTELALTTVWMRDYNDAEIGAYVASGDPLDKAGGYAIQHRELSPVSRVDGCYANVMGLPLCHLFGTLREAGCAPPEPPVQACDCFNQRTCDVAKDILPKACS